MRGGTGIIRARAPLLLCESFHLFTQWKAELDERFGLVFEILDCAYLTRMRRERGFGVNPWRTYSRFLVFHNLLSDPVYSHPMREWLGPFLPVSLLILKEARYVAPASGRRYGIETKFTRAVRELSGNRLAFLDFPLRQG